MKLTRPDILRIINLLNIKCAKRPKSNGWLDIICPYHNDKHLGSCSVEINTGVINCYSCGNTGHIFKLLMDERSLSGKEAYRLITGVNFIRPEPKGPPGLLPKVKISKFDYDFVYTNLNPNKYYYTKLRGFTQSWCEKFKVQHCLSGKYCDYMIIPIIDKEKNIVMFEARRLMEYEYLKKHYKNNASYARLKRAFKNNSVENIVTKYLQKRKVLYPPHSRVNEIIFNIDNLDYNKDIIVCEGLASLPKIQQVYTNATTIFGSNISKEQISLLSRFKRIILIPDKDNAGLKLVRILNNKLIGKVFVMIINVEDTDDNYVEELKRNEITTGTKFILMHQFS